MINVVMTVSPSGVLGMSVKGHAGYARRGKDIVCAAASALAYAAAGALEELAGVEDSHTEADGEFALTLPESMGDEERRTADTVLRMAWVGFRMIAGEHPRHLRVTVAELGKVQEVAQ